MLNGYYISFEFDLEKLVSGFNFHVELIDIKSHFFWVPQDFFFLIILILLCHTSIPIYWVCDHWASDCLYSSQM